MASLTSPSPKLLTGSHRKWLPCIWRTRQGLLVLASLPLFCTEWDGGRECSLEEVGKKLSEQGAHWDETSQPVPGRVLRVGLSRATEALEAHTDRMWVF